MQEQQQHFIVIGNGPAGNMAAMTLAEGAPESRIILISRQRGGYYRPNFLPHFIGGRISEDELIIYSPSIHASIAF